MASKTAFSLEPKLLSTSQPKRHKSPSKRMWAAAAVFTAAWLQWPLPPITTIIITACMPITMHLWDVTQHRSLPHPFPLLPTPPLYSRTSTTSPATPTTITTQALSVRITVTFIILIQVTTTCIKRRVKCRLCCQTRAPIRSTMLFTITARLAQRAIQLVSTLPWL